MPSFKLYKGNDDFFDGYTAVTYDGISRVHECVAATGYQREIICGQPDRLPLMGKRESPGHLSAEFRRGIDTNTLAASLGNHTFRWASFAFALNISVIGCQPNLIAVIQQLADHRGKKSCMAPLLDLVVHPGRAELHAVHDLVHLVHDQPHHLGLPGVDCGVEDARSIAVAKASLVSDIQPGQTMAFPELFPEFLFAVGRVDG